GVPVARPSEKALRDLRRRLGPAPMKALFEVVAGPLAQPYTPGVRFRGLRTVAFDGCSSIKVPDTDRNRCWLGRIKYRMGWAGYPTLRLMILVETGTRGLLGATLGSVGDRDEATQAVACSRCFNPACCCCWIEALTAAPSSPRSPRPGRRYLLASGPPATRPCWHTYPTVPICPAWTDCRC